MEPIKEETEYNNNNGDSFIENTVTLEKKKTKKWNFFRNVKFSLGGTSKKKN